MCCSVAVYLNKCLMVISGVDNFQQDLDVRRPQATIAVSHVLVIHLLLDAVCPQRDIADDLEQQRVARRSKAVDHVVQASIRHHSLTVPVRQRHVHGQRRKLWRESVLREIDDHTYKERDAIGEGKHGLASIFHAELVQ